MRRQVVGVEAVVRRQLLQQLPAALSRQMTAPTARREEPTGGSRIGKETVAADEIGGEGEPARLAPPDDALPSALAPNYETAPVALRSCHRRPPHPRQPRS